MIEKRGPRQKLAKLLWYGTIFVICVIMLLPFFWMFMSSFKSGLEIIRIPPTLWPEHFTFRNYSTIFRRLAFSLNFFNSFVVSGVSTVVALFTSSLTGFVFSKYRFRGKEVIFMSFIGALMIPFAVTILPMYLLIAKLNLLNTYIGLILPMCVSPFGIFLMRQFMEGIPIELVEAARLDGASEFWIYRSIMVPLSSAALAGVGVFTFLWTWNQLWWPLMVISKAKMRTLPLALAALTWQHAKRYDMIVTGAAIAAIPVIIIFAFAQQKLVKGITLTGIKV